MACFTDCQGQKKSYPAAQKQKTKYYHNTSASNSEVRTAAHSRIRMVEAEKLLSRSSRFMDVEGHVLGGPRAFEPIEPPTEAHYHNNNNTDKRLSYPRSTSTDFAIKWNALEVEEAAELREYAPKIVTFYMKKGGVGKTSTTLSVGHALARQGITTMMVDLDPQQDLTEMCYHAAASNANEGKDVVDVQDYLETQVSAGQTCLNLKDALRYLLGESRPQVPKNCNPNALLVPYAFPVRAGDGTDVPNLFHLQGGSEFHEAEAKIHARMQRAAKLDEDVINIPGALFHAIWNAGKKCNSGEGADVILLDLPPTLGATTELSIMHSHYIIVPCENNHLSEKNLMSLPRHIKGWYAKYGQVAPTLRNGLRDFSRGLQTFWEPNRNATLPLPDIEPKYLGIILNKYEVGRKGTKRNNIGEPKETRETFEGRAQNEMASRMLAASFRVSEELKSSASPMPGDEGIELSVEEDIFSTAKGEGLNAFRHQRSSSYYPQFGILACVRNGGAQYEDAAFVLGKPFSAIDTNEELSKVTKDFNSNEPTNEEEVAHFRRIFDDVASFIDYLPTPEPFNFVLDPNAIGGSDLMRASKSDRPFVVPGYPEIDDFGNNNVNAKRSARQVPDEWV